MVVRLVALLLLVGAGSGWAEVVLGPVVLPRLRGDPSVPESFLRWLDEGGRVRVDGRLGAEAGLVRLGSVDFSGSAFVHLVMLPRGVVFDVDRFHAGLGVGVGWSGGGWRVVVEPMYHESAHLADGHGGDVAADREVLSREALRLLVVRRAGGLAVGGRVGWWWHSVRPRYVWDAGLGMGYERPWLAWSGGGVGPSVGGFGYVQERDGRVSWNGEVSAGVVFFGEAVGWRVGWVAEERDGLGQDFRRRIRSWGVEVGVRW